MGSQKKLFSCALSDIPGILFGLAGRQGTEISKATHMETECLQTDAILNKCNDLFNQSALIQVYKHGKLTNFLWTMM